MTTFTSDTIVIDDAGGGNIVGGIVIGAIRGETFAGRVIGPEWFALGPGVQALIAASVVELVRELGDARHIQLCRSDLFNQAAHFLTRLGSYFIERGSFDGPIQDRTERAFYEHLIDLGLPRHVMNMFPREGEDKGRSYRALNDFCTRYLMADFPHRRRLAKENCRSFKKIEETPVERAYRRHVDGPRRRRCLECNRTVTENAYHLKCGTQNFYIHKECAPWTHKAH